MREANLLFTRITAKDSRLLSAADVEAVIAAVRDSPANRILVTVGTYGLPSVAKALHAAGISDKVVGVLGAMVPLNEPGSDAGFQLGFAWSAIQSLNPGVHVLFHGRVMPGDRVEKDEEEERINRVSDGLEANPTH